MITVGATEWFDTFKRSKKCIRVEKSADLVKITLYEKTWYGRKELDIQVEKHVAGNIIDDIKGAINEN